MKRIKKTTNINENSKMANIENMTNLWKKLKKPQRVAAPMVNMSELSFRMLLRKYGAELCFTPMYNAKIFINSQKHRNMYFSTCPDDRPLGVQFCANDPEIFATAARMVQDQCDFVDLNLGCPQGIAKKGNYGAYLLTKVDLVCSLIETAVKICNVPITCKIRILPSLEETIALVKRIESAGCSMLTVHARTKEQRGINTGCSNWEYIKEIKKVISIPLIYNGGILNMNHVDICMNEIGCNGIMVAEALLHNPALFSNVKISCINIAFEYLEMCDKYNESFNFIRGHIFRLVRQFIHQFTDIRDRLSKNITIDEYKATLFDLEKKILEMPPDDAIHKLLICQNVPYKHRMKITHLVD
ncbi:hypothetical protein A3Q56_00035 [Intoshia linei]|uniref:tRNA-dihydrouridine(16/17) synthase [NAD(P)(+)] n=1 Tax=Intoshia linei TaxID=1819745 RepID=A0A177BD99_9BILA|nr:hypothetical protein A3Q56_00035 [Intoshia linei]